MTPPGEITIAPEPYDGSLAQALVDELMADLDDRYAADGPGDGDNPEVAGAWAVRTEQVTPPAGVFLVAWLDGVAVACGGVRAVIGGPEGVAEIKRMYTAPAARRRGISRILLARLEAEAQALGYRTLLLETGYRQPEAIRLYETAGFHRIPPYGQYAGDELSVCFAKQLGDSQADSASIGPGGPERTYHSQP
jgi:GNAT superfamily N-acetyltransferase